VSAPDPTGDRRVRIYEVGPRDGLQNEPASVATADKARYIALLAAAGLREIEATSFVSPSAIPQLADADELLGSLRHSPGVRYPVLVPNLRGLARAEAAGADALAVFTATTDSFTEHNIGMTVADSLAAFAPVLARAEDLGWWRRGYVSTAFGCPYTGRVEPDTAVDVALRLLDLGVNEVCFGDTIGVGAPSQVLELTEREAVEDLGRLRQAVDACRVAGIRLAADDVGAGNAGLRLLSQLRFDIVKIDLSLVQGGVLHDPEYAVLGALKELAARWHASIVAEGVETSEQLAAVRSIGITAGQGYLLGRPTRDRRVRPIDIEALLPENWEEPEETSAA